MASTDSGQPDRTRLEPLRPPASAGDPDRVHRELLRMGADERLWEPGDTVLVAVSGGPDSMALLHALHAAAPQLGVSVAAAHADHGFRPQASAREAETVRGFCARLGVPCETAELDVPAHLAEHGGNKQAEARRLRYRFLLEAAERAGATRIALAHHADDQAETVLMRLLRGSSSAGLSGIPLRRQEGKAELIRPCCVYISRTCWPTASGMAFRTRRTPAIARPTTRAMRFGWRRCPIWRRSTDGSPNRSAGRPNRRRPSRTTSMPGPRRFSPRASCPKEAV